VTNEKPSAIGRKVTALNQKKHFCSDFQTLGEESFGDTVVLNVQMKLWRLVMCRQPKDSAPNVFGNIRDVASVIS
jgi:hypothetical protein